MKFIAAFVVAIATVVIANPTEQVGANTSVADATLKTSDVYCYWDGTAPFCEGDCRRRRYSQVDTDKCGDGKCCWTGMKVKCCMD